MPRPIWTTSRRIVLASGSPRRRELLASVGVEFEVRAADVDESVLAGEPAVDYVRRVSADKAAAVARPDELVVAADTTVEIGGEILGKPHDTADARRMLERLAGAVHHVHTAVTVAAAGPPEQVLVTTAVSFVDLDAAAIDWYVGTGEPMDKAGAYAIQGAGGALVASVDGSVTNVIGLPLAETLALLRHAAAT